MKRSSGATGGKGRGRGGTSGSSGGGWSSTDCERAFRTRSEILGLRQVSADSTGDFRVWKAPKGLCQLDSGFQGGLRILAAAFGREREAGLRRRSRLVRPRQELSRGPLKSCAYGVFVQTKPRVLKALEHRHRRRDQASLPGAKDSTQSSKEGES